MIHFFDICGQNGSTNISLLRLFVHISVKFLPSAIFVFIQSSDFRPARRKRSPRRTEAKKIDLDVDQVLPDGADFIGRPRKTGFARSVCILQWIARRSCSFRNWQLSQFCASIFYFTLFDTSLNYCTENVYFSSGLNPGYRCDWLLIFLSDQSA